MAVHEPAVPLGPVEPDLAGACGTRARNRRAETHLGLAYAVARRFRNRGVADEDLNQIALLALVTAAGRFDPAYGVPFAPFASRSIEGEIKRYFRDRAWAVHVPRAAKELYLRVGPLHDEMRHELGRRPTPGELAERLGVATGAAEEAALLAGLYQADPLDAAGTEAPARGTGDPYDEAVDTVLVGQLLGRLPAIERRVICLRYFGDLTQSEIAQRLGMNQVRVSRLIQRSLSRMRQAAAADPAGRH